MKHDKIKFYIFSLFLHGLFIGSYGLRYLQANPIAEEWTGVIGVVGAVMFWGSAFLFYVRPDSLFLSYRMRVSILQQEPYFSGELSRVQFWLYKIFLWLFLPTWPIAWVILGKPFPPIVTIYVLMFLGVLTIVNLSLLFIGYSTYLERRARNQLGIHRIWGWKQGA